jgi:hypothetical protein
MTAPAFTAPTPYLTKSGTTVLLRRRPNQSKLPTDVSVGYVDANQALEAAKYYLSALTVFGVEEIVLTYARAGLTVEWFLMSPTHYDGLCQELAAAGVAVGRCGTPSPLQALQALPQTLTPLTYSGPMEWFLVANAGPVCECGSDACKIPTHSSWCPKAGLTIAPATDKDRK